MLSRILSYDLKHVVYCLTHYHQAALVRTASKVNFKTEYNKLMQGTHEKFKRNRFEVFKKVCPKIGNNFLSSTIGGIRPDLPQEIQIMKSLSFTNLHDVNCHIPRFRLFSYRISSLWKNTLYFLCYGIMYDRILT